MPERRECSFCGDPVEPGTGKQFIKNTGRVYHFCSNKCKKNMMELGRKARNTRWTQRHAQEKAIETYSKGESEEEEEEETERKTIQKKE